MSENKIYHIKRIDSWRENWHEDVPAAQVDCFPWDEASGFHYKPVASARLAAGNESLFVFMETDETDLRMQTKGFGHVHTDSCMEFFLSPSPDSQKYLNFEFNPAAAMYLSIGAGRHDRTAIQPENYPELFQVKTNICNKGWNLEFQIPLLFLQKYFSSVNFNNGCKMRGNFYKCGDLSSRPHYGCWSPIDLPAPDFHCPAFFGRLVIEE